jgi:purine-cytosine permease-like protein
MLVSVVLAVAVVLTASAPIAFLGVPFPLVRAEAFWMSLLGYLLTPIVVIACYGWDVVSQRNGLRANRNFDIRPRWTRLLLWLSGFSIVVGAWHILNLSVPLSEWLGLS